MAFAYYPATWALCADLDLQGRDRLVLLALADHADDSGKCFPSQRRLAALTGLSVRTVRRSLEELVIKGLITRRKRYAGIDQPRRTTDLIQLTYEAESPIEVTVTGREPEHAANVSKSMRSSSPTDAVRLAGQEPPKEPVNVEPLLTEEEVVGTYELVRAREFNPWAFEELAA